MDGGRIALYDLAKFSELANIAALENEMIHKANTLKTQVSTNPGLKPVLNLYLDHVDGRRKDLIKLIEYMSSLLISLNSITLPETGDASKLHSDQTVIVFEIDRLKKLLENITLK